MSLALAWRFHGHDADGAICGTFIGPSRDDAYFHATSVLQLREVVVETDLVNCVRRLAGISELPAAEVVRLYQVIADRVDAGLSIAQGLRDARAYVTDARVAGGVALVRRSMLDGMPLFEAMARAGFAPAHTAALRAARRSGAEAPVLRNLARQVEFIERLRQRLRSLAWYPLLVISLSWLVGWGVTLFIAPRLEHFFAATSPLGMEMPPLAARYYAFAQIASRWPVVFSACWIGAPVALALVLRGRGSRRVFARLPALRQVIQWLDLASLWSAFSQLQAAGVRPVEIFTELATAASEPLHARQLSAVATHLQEGCTSLAQAVAQAGFPSFVSAEIAAGESGLNYRAAIERLLDRLHRDIDRQCQHIERLLSAASYLVVAFMVVIAASMAILPQLTAAFSRL